MDTCHDYRWDVGMKKENWFDRNKTVLSTAILGTIFTWIFVIKTFEIKPVVTVSRVLFGTLMIVSLSLMLYQHFKEYDSLCGKLCPISWQTIRYMVVFALSWVCYVSVIQ